MNIDVERRKSIYEDIMRRYRAGEFGKDHMTFHDILQAGGAPDLLDGMTKSELEYIGLPKPLIAAKTNRRR